MSELDDQFEDFFYLIQRQKMPREYWRSLSPSEKIEKLVELQEKYYQFLLGGEQNGGRPIPDEWRKWRAARTEK